MEKETITEKQREERKMTADFTAAIVKHLERDKSKDGTFTAMKLIQVMQDEDITFQNMLRFLGIAFEKVQSLINESDKQTK